VVRLRGVAQAEYSVHTSRLFQLVQEVGDEPRFTTPSLGYTETHGSQSDVVPRGVDGERGIAQVFESGYVDGLRLHYNLATLYMETVFKSSLGVQMDSFLREYGARLKNKHILYAVSTNLAEDREISRSTRGRLGGVNIKIGKSTGNPYARLKAYTNMASNYQAQFPQSGVRVLFVRTYPKRKDSQSGKPIVEVVETLLKRALRADNRKVPRRGEEIFNIDPQELFGLIETLGTEEYQYDERRSSERLGKRLLWVITDTVTGTMKLMFAEDYDSVLKKFAESTDPNLLDDRTRLLTRYYIRPVTRNFPGNVSEYAQPTEVPQEPTVEMPEASADSTPIRVTRGSRIRPRDEDDVFSSPPPQRRGTTIPTGGGAGPDLPEAPPPQRRRPTATELRDAQPNDMDFSGNSQHI
jgi:hypothetical protein